MLFDKKKPIAGLLQETGNLPRTLGVWSLIGLGIGAVIGSGLFVSTATAIADDAGASVTIAFVVAALGCALSGFCYAELASAIPISGSAYTYTYATMGELLAWIIGWDLILEYAVGAATVAISWSQYLNNLLVNILHTTPIPFAWSHSPFQVSAGGEHGIINLPALVIIALISLLLIKGTKESAWVNGIIVIVKVAIVVLIIITGWGFINAAHHTPFIPPATTYVDEQGFSHPFGGIGGILAAAGTVFFAFIGFDAVSTTAQETINPKRNMPIGVLGTLAFCTVLYILFGHVLSGLVSVQDLRNGGREASVAFAIHQAMPGYDWLAQLVTVALLAGFSSVILAMLMGQSRVFYAMGQDGLLPKVFAELHPRFQTPYKANLVILLLVGLFAAFIPGNVVGHMSSIGTLFAFILVNLSVIILRKREPGLERQFRTPWVPVVPLLGITFCAAMIYGLGWANWLRLLAWLILGLVIYFGYSKKNSKL
ncbi:amino acid permease [Mucilaginibacter sp. 14171R-50]|uniref:amino acid permease n=1 Tax=Mucilaginibacter sp. 14171R-50 TaxID=2703789 RepID=UPI00192EB9C2|nr:amino acid permease [Mucilaginibacter sp. 14171R-50]